MGFWNQDDGLTLKNQAAGTSATFALRGGSYWLETAATGTGTIDLQRLGANGVWTARATQITATAGQQTLSLPAGTYRFVTAIFTAIYLEITRIKTAVE